MAYYDPITGEYKEGEDPNLPQGPVNPLSAAAAAAPDPKASWPTVGSTGDPNRDAMLNFISRGFMERSAATKKDPAVLVDEMMDKISPGKLLLTEMLHGIGAGLMNRPYKTVREGLMERFMEEQKVKLQQQQNDSLRLQQFMAMDQRAQTAREAEAGKGERLDKTLSAKEQAQQAQLTYQREVLTETISKNDNDYEVAKQRADALDDSVEATKLRDKATDKYQKGLLDVAKQREETRRLAGTGDLYTPKNELSDLAMGIGKRAPGLNPSLKKELRTVTKDIAISIDEAYQMPDGPEKSQRLTVLNEQMVVQIDSVAQNKMPAEMRKDYDFRMQSLSVVDQAFALLAQLEAEGKRTGVVENWVEEKYRQWKGDAANPTFTKLYALLRDNFVDFRENVSGAAFGPLESKDYESIRGLASQPPEVVKEILLLIQQKAVEKTLEEVSKVDPGAPKFYIKSDKEGNPFIKIRGRAYSAKSSPWVKDLADRLGY